MGEVLNFMTLNGRLRKNSKKFYAFFTKMTQFKNLFWLSFGFKNLFLPPQNVRKISIKKLETQAKLFDVFSNDIMRKAKKKN